MLKITDQELDIYKHSASHLLAQAMQRLYPDAKLGIGPATDTGFYYDFALPIEFSEINSSQLITDLEAEIKDIIEEELPITQIYLPKHEAIDMLHQQGQIFKSELLQQIGDEDVSFFKTGDEFIDLCRGPHLKDTGKIGAIKLKTVSQAHWLGDESRPLLTRVTGIVFPTNQEFNEYTELQAGLKDRRHKKLGKKLKIFSSTDFQNAFSYTLLEHGVRLKRILTEQLSAELLTEGFLEVEFAPYWQLTTLQNHPMAEFYSPAELVQLGENYVVSNNQLAQYYEYLLKNRLPHWKEQEPGDLLIKNYYFNRILSEPTSEPDGLYTPLATEQLKAETFMAENLLLTELRLQLQSLLGYYLKLFPNGLKLAYHCEDGDLSQQLLQMFSELRLAAKKFISDSTLEIQLIYFDLFEQERVLATIKIDHKLNQSLQAAAYRLLFPEIANPEKAEHLPDLVLLDVTVISSISSLIAMLVETTAGNFPLEIAPYQVVVIPASEEFYSYARVVYNQLLAKNVRAKLDLRAITSEAKRKAAEILKYPFVVDVGEQEEKNQVLSVKPNAGEDLGLMTMTEFLQKCGLVA